MSAKKFNTPFAILGDRTEVPTTAQIDGSVSFEQGYPFGYELDYTDPNTKDISRSKSNQILYDITNAIREIQQGGVSEWSEDGKPYKINSLVYAPDGTIKQSLIANNNNDTAHSSWSTLVNASSLATLNAQNVKLTGNQTIAGVKTFSSTIAGSINGNAATATTCPNFGIGVNKISTETNLNNYLSGGKFITPATGLSNLPSGWSQARYVIDVSGGSNYASQFIVNPNNGIIAIRSYNGNTWTSWKEVVFTSDFIGTNQNKSANGYQKLPGGVILQWGTVLTTDGVGVWTYPIAFPTTCAQVFVSQDITISSNNVVGASKKAGFENTQANLASSLATGGDQFYAWAIGY